MSQKHPTDEQLLAYLDGELNVVQLRKVRRHLNACWYCRSREARLARQIRLLAEAHSRSTYPGAAEVDQNRREFFVRYKQLRGADGRQRDSGVAQLRAEILDRLPRRSLSRATAASVAFIAVVFAVWSILSPPPLTAHQVLQAVQNAEQKIYTGEPVHQFFGVEVAQLRPSQIRHSGHLDAWVDANSKRYSTRWSDQSGALRRAIWRPNLEREYVYDSQVSPRVQPVEVDTRSDSKGSLADLASNGISIADIEAGFSSWLQTRQWQPISFVSELATLATQPGSTLTLEDLDSGRGSEFRVRARRQLRGVTIEIMLDVDGDSHIANVQAVTFESDTRTVELRLTGQLLIPVRPATISSAVFEPDLALTRYDESPIPTASRKASHKELAIPNAMAPPIPSQAELDATEMEVRFALHRLGVCSGEPVQVVRDSMGIQVRGVVESPARKREIFAALLAFQELPNVSINIHAIDEASDLKAIDFSEEASRSSKTSGQQSNPEVSRTTFIATEVPIQDRLTQYFRDQLGASDEEPIDDLARRTAHYSARTVDESKRALMEAWALRRLAQRYGTHSQELSLRSRGLLELMLEDHIRALSKHTSALRTLLDPVLADIVPDSARAFGKLSPNLEIGSRETADSWAEVCAEEFHYIERTDALIIALFAGAEFPLEPDPEHPDRMIALTPERAMAELRWALLPAITNNLRLGLRQTAVSPIP